MDRLNNGFGKIARVNELFVEKIKLAISGSQLIVTGLELLLGCL